MLTREDLQVLQDKVDESRAQVRNAYDRKRREGDVFKARQYRELLMALVRFDLSLNEVEHLIAMVD